MQQAMGEIFRADLIDPGLQKIPALNKAFIDTRLRPGIATPLATHRHTAHYGQM